MLNVDTVSVSISFIVTNFPPNQINKVVCLFYQSCFTDDSQHQPSSLDDRCVFCDAWKIKVTNATWHSAPFVKTLVFIGFSNNYFFLLSVAQNVLRFLIWASHSGILWCQNHNCVFFFSLLSIFAVRQLCEWDVDFVLRCYLQCRHASPLVAMKKCLQGLIVELHTAALCSTSEQLITQIDYNVDK